MVGMVHVWTSHECYWNIWFLSMFPTINCWLALCANQRNTVACNTTTRYDGPVSEFRFFFTINIICYTLMIQEFVLHASWSLLWCTELYLEITWTSGLQTLRIQPRIIPSLPNFCCNWIMTCPLENKEIRAFKWVVIIPKNIAMHLRVGFLVFPLACQHFCTVESAVSLCCALHQRDFSGYTASHWIK